MVEKTDILRVDPAEYSVALQGYPQWQFRLGQKVRPARKGLSTDPGYESNYRQGDPGMVTGLSVDGFRVEVKFSDGGLCIYPAFDVEAR